MDFRSDDVVRQVEQLWAVNARKDRPHIAVGRQDFAALNGDPDPPAGPLIEIEPDEGGAEDPALRWMVDGNEKEAGNSVFGDCELRDDFIGLGLISFEYIDEDGDSNAAVLLRLENDDFAIEIKKNTDGKLEWDVWDRAENPEVPTCDNLTATSDFIDSHVPLEFLTFTKSQFTHVGPDEGAESARIKVKVP